MTINDRVREDIFARQQRLLTEGKLFPREKLEGYLTAFREQFRPEVLLGLDGEKLLTCIHDYSDHDSLVYWLEYKNDDDFLTTRFGSISGGSALKYGIYRRKETGLWMAGSPSAQKIISTEDAIQVARAHRDQFVAGAEVLERFAALPFGKWEYRTLQEELERVAPDVQDSSWGHKYFSLLFPELLDDYHAVEHQRFHLVKMLMEPPDLKGRYVCAGLYAQASRELDLPINHLTTVLNDRDGSPHRYWRVGTSYGEEHRSEWPAMYEQGFVGIGWDELGDLSAVTRNREGKEAVRVLLKQHFPDYDPAYAGRATAQVFRFANGGVEQGDLALAMDGATVLGVGRIKGDYYYAQGERFAHRRDVEWCTTEEWKTPEQEGLRTTLCEMKKPINLVAVESKVLTGANPPTQTVGTTSRSKPPRLEGVPAAIEDALRRKGQVILYGPPGTGKTYWAMITARELLARSFYGRRHDDLTLEQKEALAPPMCTFHPAFGYEDFLEGYRPTAKSGQLHFELREGIFKSLCREAANDQHQRYLVIDEINRGDIPRIFGELLTILEKSKRGTPITLPLSSESFSVPDNVHVIGTMNTADRSIALLDTALRRRFAFVELMPDSSVLGDATVESIPLGPWLDALNSRIRTSLGTDGRNLQVGHSYLMHDGRPISSFSRFVAILRHDIVPLLQEYCYEDLQALDKILGDGLVDNKRMEVRTELFDIQRRDQLVQALLAPCPEITATVQATSAEAQIQQEAEEELEEEQDTSEVP